MKICSSNEAKRVNLVTVRSRTPPRYTKYLKSLGKRFEATLISGTLFPQVHLNMNFETILSYANLSRKVLFNPKQPAVIDITAFSLTNPKLKENFVVDFRTPFSYELRWLGHNFFSFLHQFAEKNLEKVSLVTAANELMAKYCIECGAKSVKVVPNYPSKDFHASVPSEEWKMIQSIPAETKIVLFTAGDKLREVYGLDMLLESWKLVERSNDSAIFVFLGDLLADYIKKEAESLQLKRLFLPGRVKSKDIANWINCADVCLAPRTPGFSNRFYNDKDSTKISEYAALEKPIVATGYYPSRQYMLVESNPASFAEGILKGLDGNICPSKSHFWEDNEPELLDTLDHFFFK